MANFNHSDFVYSHVFFFQAERAVRLAVAKQIHITPAVPSCLGGSRDAKKYSDNDDDDSDTQDDASGDNTPCDTIYCDENEYVSNKTCVACPLGTYNASGNDASGNDASANDASANDSEVPQENLNMNFEETINNEEQTSI